MKAVIDALRAIHWSPRDLNDLARLYLDGVDERDLELAAFKAGAFAVNTGTEVPNPFRDEPRHSTWETCYRRGVANRSTILAEKQDFRRRHGGSNRWPLTT